MVLKSIHVEFNQDLMLRNNSKKDPQFYWFLRCKMIRNILLQLFTNR
jgi:hypothetical protein